MGPSAKGSLSAWALSRATASFSRGSPPLSSTLLRVALSRTELVSAALRYGSIPTPTSTRSRERSRRCAA
eukprot:1993167-Rhodomonas_salina.1